MSAVFTLNRTVVVQMGDTFVDLKRPSIEAELAYIKADDDADEFAQVRQMKTFAQAFFVYQEHAALLDGLSGGELGEFIEFANQELDAQHPLSVNVKEPAM